MVYSKQLINSSLLLFTYLSLLHENVNLKKVVASCLSSVGFFFLFFFFFSETGACVAHASLKIKASLLPRLPGSWGYRCALLCSAPCLSCHLLVPKTMLNIIVVCWGCICLLRGAHMRMQKSEYNLSKLVFSLQHAMWIGGLNSSHQTCQQVP